VRPRVAIRPPIVPAAPEPTLAVRGHAANGSAAALILESTGVCFVAADRSGRRRVRRFTIPEVFAIEEQRSGAATQLTLIAATTTIVICDVEMAQAWSFCRALRARVLRGVRGGGS
jgi:hypothetical protein